jgi:hypothetical protein
VGYTIKGVHGGNYDTAYVFIVKEYSHASLNDGVTFQEMRR